MLDESAHSTCEKFMEVQMVEESTNEQIVKESQNHPEGGQSRIICPTHLIEDTPSDQDYFAPPDGIGPHERVAEAIADVILSPSEAGGKMIGVEGDWGSGKTTVIRLLKKRLDQNHDVTVFTYDAWAHEGDPLRRTFLESLIQHLQSILPTAWIDQNESNKTLDEIAKRRQEESTRTIPKATKFGRNISISLFLVPLGSPLLSEALRHDITLNLFLPWKSISLSFIFGVLLAGAPLLAIGRELVRIQWPRWKARKERGKEWYKSKEGTDEEYDWSFLRGVAITETTKTTIKAPDPTSIEFENYFCKWMGEALENEPQRKIVMVLDNLDRIDPKDARSIWSTLQIFLQCLNVTATGWFNRLWVIIPYDPNGLRLLWSNRSKDSENVSNEQGDQQTSDSLHETTNIVPESFMDKSFQLRFRVSPPVLSDWKNYLMMLSSQALPHHTPDELHKIYQVYRLIQGKDRQAITPRELKLYVNQIGAIHRQWQHEFPLDHVAYYTILCRKREDIRNKLIDGKIPDETIKSVLSTDAVANLAGLHFNVKAILGQQFLLSNDIATALQNGDDTRLKKLEEIHVNRFWTVLESIMAEKIEVLNAREIANTALSLESLNLREKQIGNERYTILASLERLATGIKIWGPFRDEVPSGIQAILKLVSNHKFSNKVTECLRMSIMNPSIKGDSPDNEATILALTKICEVLKSLGHMEALQPFTLLTEADAWVNLCPHIYRQHEQWWSFFLPNASLENISDVIKNRIKSGAFTKDTIAAIRVTQRSFEKCDWTSLAKALQDRIRAEQDPTSQETIYLLEGLSLLIRLDVTQAKNSIAFLANDGHLMHRLHQSHSEKNVKCTALLITIFLELRMGAEKPGTVGNSEAGYSALISLLQSDNYELARDIIDILDEAEKINLLLAVIDKRNYDPLIISCLRLIAESKEPERLFSPAVLMERWKVLIDYLNKDGDDRFDKLLATLCANTNLITVIQEKEGGFNYENILLYLRLCIVSSSQTFREWCRAGIELLDSKIWAAELEKDGSALILLLFLIDNGVNVTLTKPFQDALVDYTRDILIGTKKVAEGFDNKLPKYVDALRSPASRTMLRRRLISEAMNRDGKVEDVFFQIYGDFLLEDIPYFYGEKNIIARLFSPLLREKNPTGLRWMSKIFEAVPDILTKSEDRHAAEDFRERIQEEPKRKPKDADETNMLIWSIAKSLGITPKPPRLKIIKAQYWTENKREDVTEELREEISDNKLEILVSNEIKLDPDPGVRKNLTIEYAFDDISGVKEYKEGDLVTLP
jgi:hypothetical protein